MTRWEEGTPRSGEGEKECQADGILVIMIFWYCMGRGEGDSIFFFFVYFLNVIKLLSFPFLPLFSPPSSLFTIHNHSFHTIYPLIPLPFSFRTYYLTIKG